MEYRGLFCCGSVREEHYEKKAIHMCVCEGVELERAGCVHRNEFQGPDAQHLAEV